MFGEILFELRNKSGQTQESVATALGVVRTTYAGYENGREPDYQTLVNIANHFKVTIDYLLGNSNYPFDDKFLTPDELEYVQKSLEVYRQVKAKIK